jgi:hypothetical protein
MKWKISTYSGDGSWSFQFMMLKRRMQRKDWKENENKKKVKFIPIFFLIFNVMNGRDWSKYKTIDHNHLIKKKYIDPIQFLYEKISHFFNIFKTVSNLNVVLPLMFDFVSLKFIVSF